jgi:hypothetical protein
MALPEVLALLSIALSGPKSSPESPIRKMLLLRCRSVINSL